MAAAVFGSAAALLIWHPETPLPPEWNPTEPLEIRAPLTALTGWKMQRAAATESACLAVLDGEPVQSLPPLEVDDPDCGIDPRVRVSGVGRAAVAPVETTCAVALRLAMWERHGLQPAAEGLLGSSVARIEHQSSYSCRTIRTIGGGSGRMSLHATAEAIDVKGFVLSDNRRISLLDAWDGGGPEAAFLRAVRNSSCTWFATTLGPDYNALHGDHFHLQSRGWGLCR